MQEEPGKTAFSNHPYTGKVSKMKKRTALVFAMFAVLSFVAAADAQFTIKLPKIKTEKPKVEEPRSDSSSSPSSSTGTPAATSSGYPKFDYAAATNVAKFMRNSVEVTVKTEHLNYVSKFIPKIRFDSYYDGSSKLRYVAEWTKADGSPWFTEQLDTDYYSRNSSMIFKSPYSDETFQAHATGTIGSFGVKITDSKAGTTVFQGKFKVGKLPMDTDPARKNYNLFYVDNDWSLNVGAVGFDFDNWHLDQLNPSIFLWFKGTLDTKDFEARLFHNNQMVASTDDGGYVNSERSRGEECFLKPELCKYTLWKFHWTNFILENNDYGRSKYPKAIFTRDKPGEYVAKIFHKGVQVREVKFTIDSRGFFAPNPYAEQTPMIFGGLVVPAKVMGTVDKLNPAAVKNEMFYGNPLPNFVP